MTNNGLKKLVAGLLAVAFLGSLTACNTMQGAGKDMERAGEKVQKEAKEAK